MNTSPITLPFISITQVTAPIARRDFLNLAVKTAAAVGLAGCAANQGARDSLAGTPVVGANTRYQATKIASFDHAFPAAAIANANRFALTAPQQGDGLDTNRAISLDSGSESEIAANTATTQYINHVVELNDNQGYALITNGGIIFADTHYNATSFVPHYNADHNVSGGAMLRGPGLLFVTSSQLEDGGAEGKVAGTGAVTGYDFHDGQPLAAYQINLEGKNPTGMAYRAITKDVIILTSGNELAPNPTLVFVKPNLQTYSVSLPSGIVASGDLAVSDDGQYAFFGTRDNSGKVYRVNLDNPSEITSLDLGTEFHSSVKYAGGKLFVASYHEGLTHVIDPATMTLIDELPLDGEAGPAAVTSDGKLLQTVNGGVFEIAGIVD